MRVLSSYGPRIILFPRRATGLSVILRVSSTFTCAGSPLPGSLRSLLSGLTVQVRPSHKPSDERLFSWWFRFADCLSGLASDFHAARHQVRLWAEVVVADSRNRWTRTQQTTGR